MSDLTEIIRRGTELGMSPDTVVKLIEEEQRLIRDKADREERAARDKADREERAAEREFKKLEMEIIEADKRRAHELTLADKRSSSESVTTASESATKVYEGLKLPIFNDGQDDIDSYIWDPRYEAVH